MEAFLDGEWESLSKLFSCEDSDAMLHCNTNNLLPSYPWSIGGEFDANLYNNLDSFHSVSQESSSAEIERSLFVSDNAASFFHSFPDDLMEEILHLKAQTLCDDELDNADASQVHNSSQASKKRPRETKRNAQTKKAKRGAQASNNDEEMINNGGGQSSSMYSSEGGDCNALEESVSKGSTSAAKAKASKSPATDPQSLYARKRRERINERLKILQNLVPNGTKVDISTMLEEAVQYVKFLQLQIKLLSSDDMWMYAPIAYNGMDMGLYQRIAPNL